MRCLRWLHLPSLLHEVLFSLHQVSASVFSTVVCSSRRKRNLRPVLATVAEIDAGVDHSAWDIFHE